MRFFVNRLVGARFRPNSAERAHLPLASQIGHTTTTITVGGVNHVVFDEDLQKHPASILTQMIADYKRNAPDVVVPLYIERDGGLFKHVNAFLMNGQVSKDLDTATLHALGEEAAYYDIQNLQKQCGHAQQTNTDLGLYLHLRKVAREFKRRVPLPHMIKNHKCDTMQIATLSNKLQSEVLRRYSASCISGDDKIFQFKERDDVFNAVKHLITPSQDITTVLDVSTMCTEPLAKAAIHDLSPIAALVPGKKLSLKICKVVINREGGTFALGPRAQQNNLVGTLVVAVHPFRCTDKFSVTSEPDGGLVEAEGEWVVVDCDCTLTVNPATASKRVLMVYDIYGEEDADAGTLAKHRTRHWNHCTERNLYKNDVWRSGYQGLEREAENVHWYTSFRAERKQEVLDAVQRELCGAASVTIGMRDLYLDGRDSPAHLNRGDRALYDILSEQYEVCVVSALIYEMVGVDNTYGFRSASLLPITKSVATDRMKRKDKLVLPHQISIKNELIFRESCECIDGGYNQQAVFVVSGLRVKRK